MIRSILLAFLFTGCSLLSFPEEEDIYEDDDEEIYAAAPPVTPMHWSCCSDLCKSWKNVASIATELDSPYINCECKNKKKFRVTRTWPLPR